jgi:hypothetical protein
VVHITILDTGRDRKPKMNLNAACVGRNVNCERFTTKRDGNMIRNFLMMTAAIAALMLTATNAPAQDASGDSSPNGLYERSENELYVPSGKQRRLAFLHGAKVADCVPWDVNQIEVRVVNEPKNGTLKFGPEDGVATFKANTPLGKCAGKKTRGIAINYKSTDKFVGTDEFEIFVVWPNNRGGEVHYTVNVK